jgi:uncharacterized cupredoxin-like copper-binding protein
MRRSIKSSRVAASRLAVAIVVAAVIVVVAAVSFLYLIPRGPTEISLTAQEFGFNQPSGGPTIRIKSGEQVKIVLVNRGGMDHEFMIVKNVESFHSELDKKVMELQGMGMSMEEIMESEELEMLHHKYVVMDVLTVNGVKESEVEVEPGERKEFFLTLTEPGTYYYVCAEVVGVFPHSHIDRGMWGVIEVTQ